MCSQRAAAGPQDIRPRPAPAAAVVSADRGKALELIDDVVRVAMSAGGAQIVAIAKTVTTFDAESVPFTPIDERTGAGDKAQAQDDWVPEAWRDEAEGNQ